MSYILDALRKADSDRERGAVPGIHTQSAPTAGGDSTAPRRNALVWAAIVVSALLVAALAWWLFGREAEVTRPSTAAPPAVVVAQPAPAPAVVVPTTPAPPVASLPPAPVTTAPTLAAPAIPAPQVAAPPVAKPPHTGVAALRPPPPQKTPAAVAPQAPAAAASVEPRIYGLSELPEPIRRELPQLTVGGSIYSDNAANRFLIINGQIFHEGDKLAPDLWLEQIRLKAAVLRYKDYRYTLRF